MINENVTKLIEARRGLTQAMASKNPDPDAIDRYMSQLVHYLGVVGDSLSELEREYEDEKIKTFLTHKKTASVNQADQLARFVEGKGDIAKLTRLVNIGWSTITSAQSKMRRFEREMGVKND